MADPIIMRFLVLIGFLFSSNAYAGFLEFNAFYFADTMNMTEASTTNRTFFELAVGFSMDKKGDYLVGWNYGSYTATDTSTTTASYSSTQMGPRFLFMLNKAKTWSLGTTYNLVTSAKYSPGGSGVDTTWKGTGIKVDVGYNFDLSGTLIGIRLNYASGSYNEEITGGTALGAVSYSRNFIYPSIYTIYNF
ncbi:MAG: hypothetical protein AB7H97_15365 [Pseudobdellovibrionaceae bacterium]